MSGDEVTQIMMAAASADPATRNNAEQQIEAARQNDLPSFLVALVKELRTESKPGVSRQMAGLVLKNSVAFSAREEDRRVALEAAWRSIAADVRDHVKAELLVSLESTKEVRLIVSLVVANLARIELPHNQWPDLIPKLCAAVESAHPQWMETALMALGYICEECFGNDALTNTLAAQSMPILNAIFQGLSSGEPVVKYTAVNALCNAIDFIGHHMTQDAERSYLINAICEAAAASEEDTRAKALETLVVLAKLYYEHLGPHMNQLWNVTTNAIYTDSGTCGLQGLLFWLAVAEVEAELDSAPTNGNYCGNFVKELFELTVACMQQQEEGQTEDDWNISTAASKVLVALAEAAGDNIMSPALPWIQQNIEADGWRQQEAAIVACGCVLHGPDPREMRGFVMQVIPILCTRHAGNPNPMIRDSAMWALSMAAAEYGDIMLRPDYLPSILEVVAPTLQQEPTMVSRGAAVIHNLCLEFDDDDAEDGPGGAAPTNALSPYYQSILEGLFNALDRQDVTDHKMRHDVQEALNRLFGAAAPDCYQVLLDLVPMLLQRLRYTCDMAVQQGLTSDLELSQGLLVGSLNHICRKVGYQVEHHVLSIVEGIEHMLRSSREGSVLVEAIMCIGALGLAMRQRFVPYLERVHAFVQAALTSFNDYDLCASAIATLGDLATACEAEMAPMLPETMTTFMNFLQSEEGDRDIKSLMIHCLGDLTLNVGGQVMHEYLTALMPIVQAIGNVSRELYDSMHTPEDEEFIAELWEAIFSFGTGLMQGYAENVDALIPYVEYFLAFVLNTCAPGRIDDGDVLKAGVTLIGDIANVFRHGSPQYIPAAKGKLCTPEVQAIIEGCMAWETDDGAIVESAKWAFNEVQQLSRA
jgi:importin subunit beta-1